ncbi:MAG: hypothetical protein AMJ58_12250 [Gammaproteobacteria bacterium SG8_30]|nr:MAG: hypothetical protein AMJ58_12250 [Gammaproteobacteria bacterium SG8_30]
MQPVLVLLALAIARYDLGAVRRKGHALLLRSLLHLGAMPLRQLLPSLRVLLGLELLAEPVAFLGTHQRLAVEALLGLLLLPLAHLERLARALVADLLDRLLTNLLRDGRLLLLCQDRRRHRDGEHARHRPHQAGLRRFHASLPGLVLPCREARPAHRSSVEDSVG